MRTLFDKILLIVLDGLASVTALITIGMLAILVGAVGAFFGFAITFDWGLSDSIRYGVIVLCAVVAPVWLGVRLWQWWNKADDAPPKSN
jgi:hypothetical protein